MLMLQLLYSTAWCLVLLCLFCDISSGSDKERRDVHRIIIKEKVNRSRANNHHHNREHPRSHQYESYEKNREHEVRKGEEYRIRVFHSATKHPRFRYTRT